MKFGIAIPTDADSWRLVRRAEELGFHHAWFHDTQMLSAGRFVAMAACAMQTGAGACDRGLGTDQGGVRITLPDAAKSATTWPTTIPNNYPQQLFKEP